MALRPITKYNGYDCEKDPKHLFTPLELAQLRAIDMRIGRMPPTAFDDYEPELTGPCVRLKPSEKRDHKKAIDARWRANHREERREANRIYREAHKDEIKARTDARRDIINARRRARRQEKKEEAL